MEFLPAIAQDYLKMYYIFNLILVYNSEGARVLVFFQLTESG